MIEMCTSMTEPQLPWLHRPTPMVVTSSPTFLQFGKKKEIRRRQIGPIWVIQDSGTKVSNLRSWPRTCVLSSIVEFNEWLLHMRTNSSKSRFQLSQHFKISLWVNVCASTHKFWMRQAFTVPENLSITLPADGVGNALRLNSTDCIWRSISKPCTLLSSLVMIHSFSILSDDRSKASSTIPPPHSAI